MYRIFILTHVATSCIFMVIAIWLTLRSFVGWKYNRIYNKTDQRLTNTFLALLYMTMILGVAMYFFIEPSIKLAGLDSQHLVKHLAMRFWAVEHLYVMTFALILSQIGRVFIVSTTTNSNRFGYALFYYGLATLITIVSMIFYFIYR